MDGNGLNVGQLAVTKLTVQMRDMSLEPSHDNLFKQVNLVQLMREEIRTLGIEGNLLFHSDITEDPIGMGLIESHALTSYCDGLRYLHGSHGFPQNLKAAIRELTISKELGNQTAKAVLDLMQTELGDELRSNYYAIQLWNRGIQDGVEAAGYFLNYMQPVTSSVNNQFVTPSNYFDVTLNTVNY